MNALCEWNMCTGIGPHPPHRTTEEDERYWIRACPTCKGNLIEQTTMGWFGPPTMDENRAWCHTPGCGWSGYAKECYRVSPAWSMPATWRRPMLYRDSEWPDICTACFPVYAPHLPHNTVDERLRNWVRRCPACGSTHWMGIEVWPIAGPPSASDTEASCGCGWQGVVGDLYWQISGRLSASFDVKRSYLIQEVEFVAFSKVEGYAPDTRDT